MLDQKQVQTNSRHMQHMQMCIHAKSYGNHSLAYPFFVDCIIFYYYSST